MTQNTPSNKQEMNPATRELIVQIIRALSVLEHALRDYIGLKPKS